MTSYKCKYCGYKSEKEKKPEVCNYCGKKGGTVEIASAEKILDDLEV